MLGLKNLVIKSESFCFFVYGICCSYCYLCKTMRMPTILTSYNTIIGAASNVWEIISVVGVIIAATTKAKK